MTILRKHKEPFNVFTLLRSRCQKYQIVCQQTLVPRMASGGSRISPRWGPQLSGGGATSILPNFPENCMKLKEFGPPGGTDPLRPLRSATDGHQRALVKLDLNDKMAVQSSTRTLFTVLFSYFGEFRQNIRLVPVQECRHHQGKSWIIPWTWSSLRRGSRQIHETLYSQVQKVHRQIHVHELMVSKQETERS